MILFGEVLQAEKICLYFLPHYPKNPKALGFKRNEKPPTEISQ